MLCPFCDHAWHAGVYCDGWSECDDDCGPHECACSFPDSHNYAEVPVRPLVGTDTGKGET